MLFLRSLFFTVLFPGTVTVFIPYWLVSSDPGMERSYSGVLHSFGLPLMIVGGTGLLGCIWQFFAEGRGTLAPVDPPKHLVVRGLYRSVRNPMYVCVLLVLCGEAIFFQSQAILIEAGVFFLCTHLFVTLYEEPALRKQFGASYEDYVQKVGRWIPRLPDKHP
ncbi:MAG: isoprenylcysteine carboxylmethyltransferase family protein [Acidobacteria bacterium]|nr:isoprenylcysteine carboxylmethyltransferase family protein [Acidobacteriota bacterium]